VGLSRSSDSLQQRVLTLGKQVSDRLFVSVAQGLETSSPALRLRYTLSSKLSAEVEAGTISFLSLFYNIAFD
jgi:translocation and assembly module TamB